MLTGPTRRGQVVEVTLKLKDDDGDKVMTHYQVPHKADPYVESVTGKNYVVCVHNISNQVITFKASIDGHLIARFYIMPGQTSHIEDMMTGKTEVGGQVKEIRQKLVFKQPTITQEGTTLDRAVRTADPKDKLGCIDVEVYDVQILPEGPTSNVLVDVQSLEAPVQAGEGKKGGAFRTATGRGESLEKSYFVSERTSIYGIGPNLLETVTVRYASRALLLLMGTPPQLFMKANQNQNQGPIELSDDDDRPSKRAKAASSSSSTATAKMPASSASSSSTTTTAVKKEAAPAPVKLELTHGDDDDITDLT